MCKVLAEDVQDEKKAVAGIRDDEVRKYGVGMPTAFTEYPEDAKFVFRFLSCFEINDGTSIVIMNMAVPGTSTDRTGFQMWLKTLHIGIKQRF